MSKESMIEQLHMCDGDKVSLLLVSQGVKPASFADLHKQLWSETTPEDWKLSVDEERKIEMAVKTLGIPYIIKIRNIIFDGRLLMAIPSIYFGMEKANLDRMVAAKTHDELGRAYGYPETAIEAFIGKRRRHDCNFPRRINIDDLVFSEFVKSNDNWEEEIATGRIWAATVKQQSQALYRSYQSSLQFYNFIKY